jgi:tRNA U34 2-thiouridine synthase MnmA/TrmU
LELYDDKLKMDNINYINPEIEKYFKENNSLEAKCKIRYRQSDQECEVKKLEYDLYEVKFTEKQRAIAR